MVKSMQESGGRSLSMNWKEAKSKNYADDYKKEDEGHSDSD